MPGSNSGRLSGDDTHYLWTDADARDSAGEGVPFSSGW